MQSVLTALVTSPVFWTALVALGLWILFRRSRPFFPVRRPSPTDVRVTRAGQTLHAARTEPDRIAAIQHLDALARDSLAATPQVTALLCAFVRNAGPATRSPRPDLAAALTALMGQSPDQRRATSTEKRHGPEAIWLDLTGADLRGLDIRNHRLDQALFRTAGLQDAILSDIRAESSDFTAARMASANLDGAALRWCTFRNADLRGASLRGVHLVAAAMDKARLSGTDLRGARIEGGEWHETSLDRADLSQAALEDLWALGLSLRGTRASGALLRRLDLFSPALQGAVLTDARIEDCLLDAPALDRSTVFAPASLRGTAIRQADLSAAPADPALWKALFADASVRLPEGMTCHPDAPATETLPPDIFRDRWHAWQTANGYAPQS